jgi:aminopeptidase N
MRVIASLIAGAAMATLPEPVARLPSPGGATAHWTTTRLDLDLTIDTAGQRLQGHADLRVRLDDSTASSLTLTIGAASRMLAITGDSGITASLDTAGAEATVTVGGRRQGDEINLHVRFVNRGQSFQLVVSGKGALASWARGWYPVLAGAADRAPGTTRLRIPAQWRSLSNGALVDSAITPRARVESWYSDAPVARSFVAAAYRVERRVAAGRQVAAYLLPASDGDPTAYAEMIGKVIAAVSPVFGPYPYQAYAIAEIPAGLVTWTGSSEQGFFMASGLGTLINLPLFAHELSHGWWGNHVLSANPAAQMTSEALAQLGAALAIEGIEGRAAAVDFLRFSRDGYNSRQCARGYFAMRRAKLDKPLMQLAGSPQDHNLSDAKGHWVYWMLRERVGPGVFATVFQQLQRDFAQRPMSLADLRRAFVAGAPVVADLTRFFEEWLDRAGAPSIGLRWRHGGTDAKPTALITIGQRGDIYHLPITIAIETARDTVTRTVQLSRAEETFTIAVNARPTAVQLDPRHDVLRWQPEYGPEPSP